MSKALKAINSKVDFSRHHVYRCLLMMIALCLTELRSEWEAKELNCILSLSLVAPRTTKISIETRRTSVALSHRRCSRMDQISLDRPLLLSDMRKVSDFPLVCFSFFLEFLTSSRSDY